MMKDIIIKISKETRKIYTTKSFIGNDGENLQGNIIFQFEDEFVDGIARLEYEIKGEKTYLLLEKVEDSYIIPIKSVLTKEGQINMQIVITEEELDEEIPIFKSNVFYLYCSKSINAEIEQPDEYPQWIEVANQKMIRMEQILNEAEQMEREALQLDEDVRELEQMVSNLDLEIDDIELDINDMAQDIDNNSKNITTINGKVSKLESDLLEQEESINHLDDIKADKTEIPTLENYYTKEEVDNSQKGFATTSSLITAINGCEPKMPNSYDYCIQSGLYGGGESGYRKYKNGVLEQWGVATTNASETEFNMHQSHIDQNFSIFIEPREQGNFFHYAIPSGNQKFKCRIQSRDSQSMALKFQWRSWGRWK